MNIFSAESTTIITPIIVILITFYFIIYLPQKTYRTRTAMVANSLKPGVTITTANGISGTVIYVLTHTLIVLTADGQKIEVLTQGVTNINP